MPYTRDGEGRLYYEVRGAGPPVVLLHGFGEDGRALGPLVRALAGHYRVLVPDLPGYGRSTPQPRTFPLDFYRQDALRLLAWLAVLGLDRVHLGGFSDGAELALWMAILDPQRIRSVLAWGVAGALDAAALPEIAAIGRLVDAPPLAWRDWRAALCRTYGREGAHLLTTRWAATLQAIIAAGGEISLARVGEIRCPTLLINGAADSMNPPALAQRLAARIPQADLIILPDTGHAVHEERPDWFQATALAWLARQPALPPTN
jgi:pimeloyl-ACP methyl ester carboxylesterase